MGGSASKALGKDLIAAAAAGDTAQVQTLLAAKAPVDHANTYGYTSLMYASDYGHSALVETLLAAKAPVNQADKRGYTSLMEASRNGRSALMELLLTAKANVDQADKLGRTALTLASMRGHSEPVELLLTAKANADQTDNVGQTALDWARKEGNIELANLLDFWSQLTPLMVAVVLQSPQEIKALLHEGADPTCTVQLPSGTQTAHSLAMNDPPRTWFSTTCSDTAELIESSLTWSVESHYLFPPGFRRGVRNVCGLKVALDRAEHQLSNPVWMIIIAYLPRNWAV